MHCYSCRKLLDDKNESLEHIIPNALGGTLKSKLLICKDCNNLFGHNLDITLCDAFKPIATMLQIRRDRGQNQAFNTSGKVDGHEYVVHPEGSFSSKHPNVIIEEKIVKGKRHVKAEVLARSKDELQKILNGLKSKYESKLLEIVSKELRPIESKPEMLVNLEMGSDDIFKAIGKIAISFAKLQGIRDSCFDSMMSFINDKEANHLINSYYPNDDHWKESPMIAHQLFLHGLPEESILYCLVEILGFYKYFVLIDENYSGQTIHASYQYDLIQHKEFTDKSFDSILSRTQVAKILGGRYFTKPSDIESRAKTILTARNTMKFVFVEKKKN